MYLTSFLWPFKVLLLPSKSMLRLGQTSKGICPHDYPELGVDGVKERIRVNLAFHTLAHTDEQRISRHKHHIARLHAKSCALGIVKLCERSGRLHKITVSSCLLRASGLGAYSIALTAPSFLRMVALDLVAKANRSLSVAWLPAAANLAAGYRVTSFTLGI